ncbi:hypothetical protein LJK87_04915 [Paenibacillus sp. P25]|nr:hypothetical protein LJK87_04915 [Paenibacillus sp. P25]
MNPNLQVLLQEAGSLPDGAAKLEVLEAAVRIADAEGLLELAYDIRSDIVRTAIFNGFPLKAIVAFSWQLGQYDRRSRMVRQLRSVMVVQMDCRGDLPFPGYPADPDRSTGRGFG